MIKKPVKPVCKNCEWYAIHTRTKPEEQGGAYCKWNNKYMKIANPGLNTCDFFTEMPDTWSQVVKGN